MKTAKIALLAVLVIGATTVGLLTQSVDARVKPVEGWTVNENSNGQSSNPSLPNPPANPQGSPNGPPQQGVENACANGQNPHCSQVTSDGLASVGFTGTAYG